MIDEKDYICCFILILNMVNGMTKDKVSLYGAFMEPDASRKMF